MRPRHGTPGGAASRTRPALPWALALSTLIAASVDLGLSALHGYKLARPLWPLPPPLGPVLRVLAFELLLLGACVTLVHLGLLGLSRLPRLGAPLARMGWSRVLAAALAPVLAWRGIAGIDAAGLWLAGAAGVGWIGLALRELRRELPMPARGAVVCASVGLAATLAAALALPARELSRVAPFEGPIGRPASAELPNLLLIVLDTVRADHLGSYGYGRDTTPFLDDLAARASLFERAVAASSYTLPSHASLFTGLYPESHGARVSEVGKSLEQLGLLADATRVSPLSPEAVTLAELAREAGLETGAVGANLAYLSPAFGLDQGFDSYLVPTRGWSFWQPAGIAIGRKLSERLWPRSWAFWYRSRVIANGRFYLLAPEVNALALRWLESRTETRFFLFLNYMDAHAPYLPAAGYRDLFPFADSPQQLDREAIESGRRQITGAERDPLIDAYDAELRFLDDHLRRLFARLEAWELLSRTAVIIVGDHGESFGEHGELEHATGLREPQLHVPLIVSLPGRTGPERIARPVHLSDVFPTALRMLGLEPPPQLDGVPLFAPERRHPVTAHLGPYGGAAPRDAIYRDSYKLLVEPGKAAALYDVSSDAAEERDLAPDRPELASELHSELRRFKSEVRPRFRPDPAPLDPETRDRLRALGYEP